MIYDPAGHIKDVFRPPDYSVGPTESFGDVVSLIHRDFFNSLGIKTGELIIEWPDK